MDSLGKRVEEKVNQYEQAVAPRIGPEEAAEYREMLPEALKIIGPKGSEGRKVFMEILDLMDEAWEEESKV